NAAIEVAPPKYCKDELGNRNERKFGKRARRFQQQREDPVGGDSRCKDREGISWMRIKPEQIESDRVAEEWAEEMRNQEDAGAAEGFVLSLQMLRHEPIEQRVNLFRVHGASGKLSRLEEWLKLVNGSFI